jgi:type I restriction enzyme S subunit
MTQYTEIPLPESWVEVEIGDVADVKGGKRLPKGKSLLESKTAYPYIRVTDFEAGSVDLSNLKYLDQDTQKAIKNYTISKNDLYISIAGTIGLVGEIPSSLDGANLTENAAKLCDLAGIEKKYLRYVLSSNSSKEQFDDKTTSSGQPKLALFRIKNCRFSFPPLAEQKIIADKLDTLLAQVGTTKARLDRIPNILKTFRQSVLAAAVSGKLTEEWRDNNSITPAHETIKKIEKFRQESARGKDKKAQSHLKEEEYIIPNTWQWVSLDTLTKKITDGTHHTPKYTESGVHFISVKDIRDGKIDFSDTKFISQEEHRELSRRCPVEIGDLLITKSGTIGRTAIVETTIDFSLFVSVALIKPASDEVNAKFIDMALRKWINEIDISSRIVGSAIKNLHLRDMKVLAIPFAPKEEQTEIVRRVEELFAFADSIEQKTNSALERVNNLTQSILAKAFRGELTADWRSENPDLISGENSAEALLAKIQAEREKLALEKKAAKKPRKKT